jgi:hypothetical protein
MSAAVRAALLAAGTLALALAWAGAQVRDLDVRSAPWRINLGHLRAGSHAGEVFTAVRDGLERIDVAVEDFTEQPTSEVELVLRADGPDGVELRRALGARLEPGRQGGWLVFEFEPVEDSGGRRFHASIGPAPGVEVCWYAPWMRFRGSSDRGSRWGESVFEGPVVEGRFISDHAPLRGLAFGGEELSGAAELVLLDLEGRELRRSRVEFPEPVEWGWIVFGFEPLAESRWRTLAYRVELPAGARLRGSGEEPARLSFFGGGRVDEHLGGLTHGGRTFADRDLALRTWSARGPGVALGLLRERLGARGLAAALLSLLASAALAAGLRRGSTSEGAS